MVSLRLIVILLCLSFAPIDLTEDPVKKLEFEFTVEETNIIYSALGKQPAEQTEELRRKISIEFKRQMLDGN